MEKGGDYDYRDDDRIIPQGQIVNVQPPDEDMKSYVQKRYDNAINYYWKAGSANKRTYKRNRSLVIVLGAAVTLLSSMISATFVNGAVETLFAIAAPVSAAIPTMINGFTQSF